MSKSWRPPDWKDPYVGTTWIDLTQCPSIVEKVQSEAFEAGADAMLEALKRDGSYCEYEKPTVIKGLTEQSKGWLVFIPDETDDEQGAKDGR